MRSNSSAVDGVSPRSKATRIQAKFGGERAGLGGLGPRDRIAYLVRLGTLAYWVPAVGIDLMTLSRARFSPEAMGFVFWLLFRQSVVFLALWFGFGLVQALMFGRARREPRLSKRREGSGHTVLMPSRDRRVS